MKVRSARGDGAVHCRCPTACSRLQGICISYASAAPVGTHTVTIRAIDNGGATRDTTFALSVSNSAPRLARPPPISRQQGWSVSPAVTIGTLSDPDTNAGSLTVSQIAGGTASGVTATEIVNTAGTASTAGSFTGSLSANTSTGVVSIGSAGPIGSYTITLTAVDNCSLTPTRNFSLSVNGHAMFANGFEQVRRRNRAPCIQGAAPGNRLAGTRRRHHPERFGLRTVARAAADGR